MGSLFSQFAPKPGEGPKPAAAPTATPAPKPSFSVTEKYAAIWRDVDLDDVRTLLQAREVKRRLEAEGFLCSEIHGNGRAVGSQAAFIPESQLVAEGFPLDWPALWMIFDPSGDGHAVDQLEKWLNSSLWRWGLAWCLRRVW